MADIYDQLLDQGVVAPNRAETRLRTPRATDPTPPAQTDVYDDLLDGYQAAQNQRLQSSLNQALSVVPERAASTRSLAKATGLPEDVVERNLETIAHRARVRELQSMLADSPILARQMSDPQFAKLAHDDYEPLSLLERIPRQFAGGAIEMAGRTVGGFGHMLNILQRNILSGIAGLVLPEPIAGGSPAPESLIGNLAGEGAIEVGGRIKSFAQDDIMIPQRRQTFADQVSAGLGQVGAQILLYVLSGGTAATATMFTQGVDIMADLTQKDDASQGAKDLAMVGGGLVTGLTEKWALDRILGPLALPVQNQIVAALARIGIAGFSEGTQELTESVLHDVIRKSLTNRDAEIDIPGAYEEGQVGFAVGAIVRGIVESALRVRVRHQRLEQQAEEAEHNAEVLDRLHKATAASKLLEHSPESFEQFIEAATQDGPVQSVYLDAGMLMQSGIAQELAQISPSVAEQIEEAAALGGTVQIPIAEYATRIAPTEHADALLEHIKTDPDGFTRAEAREYMQTQAEQLEAEVEQRIAQHEGQNEFRESQQRVKDLVHAELNALNRFTESKNELDATLIAARTAVRAAQMGITPEQLFERQRLRFAAESITGDTFDQQGNLQTDTPAFREWFGDSKVVDDAGTPQVVYHGTTSNIDAFRHSALGVNTGAQSAMGGFFFTNDPLNAQEYAGGDVSRRGAITPQEIMAGWPEEDRAAYQAAIDHRDSLKPKGTKYDDWMLTDEYRERNRAASELFEELLSKNSAGPNIMPVYLSLQRPLEYDMQGRQYRDVSYTDLIKEAKRKRRDGVIIRNTYDPEFGDVYIAFRPEQIKSAIGNRGTFDPSDPNILHQSAARGARGAYSPDTNTIALLKNADLSTFLHEAGHYFFESDIALASEIVQANRAFGLETATEGERQIVADVSALLEWHGIKGEIEVQLATWHNLDFEEKRAYHERTAESFERYLFEGKAPSIELQSYFQQFRAWLLNVYRSLKDFLERNPSAGELSDEVRAVFDRMLATNEEIELAETGRSMMPLFRTRADAENVGLTPEEFAAYQAQDPQASNDAIQDLQSKGLRDLQWLRNAHNREVKKLQRQAKALRHEARIDARREIMNQPVYRAWTFLTRKLDGSDQLAPAPRTKSDPDVVDPTQDSLFKAIAKLGGIRKDDVVTQWGIDPSERPASGVFGKPVLRATEGHDIDTMRQMLVEHGYLDGNYTDPSWDPNEFESKFDAELRGDVQYSNQVSAEALTGDGALAGEGNDIASLTGGRLDLPSLREMGFSEDEINVLKARRMTASQGLHPDLVSELPGIEMTSGDELVRALLEAEPPQDAIEALTDVRMLEQHGELATPEAIEREADRAIHNDARARMVATEANALARATGQRRILTTAAKQFAQAMVARVKVRDVRPSVYANAATRAGKAAEQASRAGDVVQAGADKRTQLVNVYATRAAHDARAEVDRGVRYLTRFNTDGSRKGLDADYLEQIDTLLDRFDLRRGQSLKAIDRRKALAQWVEDQELAGLEPDIPEYLIHEANRTHYKDLTVEQFRGLVETVRQIEHLGRLKKKLLTAKDQRELDTIVDEIKAKIIETSDGREVDNERRATLASQATHFGRWVMATHRKASSVVREMDGFEDGGPLWEYFIRTMNEAGDKEADMRAKAAKRLHEISQPILKGEELGGKGRYFPTLDRSFNRGERLALALNWGNDGNRQRMLGGRNWTAEQVQPVLQSLSASDWTFVQNVWDFFESYRPEIAAKERRVYGREPDWIEPTPFEVQTADGEVVSLRGGYYPIKYDPHQSGRAAEFAEAEEAKAMMRAAHTAATTRRSYTKTRAEEVHGRPVLLTFDGIWQGANELIHDLSWHEWAIDANRLLKRLDDPIRTHYGAQYVDVLRNTVKDSVRGDIPATNVMEKSLNHVRIGSTVVGLGWNLTTAMLQPLGISQSFVRTGGKWIMKGLAQFYGSPLHMAQKAREIRAMSPMMENRALTMNREINDVRNRLESRSDLKLKLEATYFLLIQKLQAGVDYPTWLGAYEKAMADPKNDEARAIALADQAVMDSQSGGQIKDMAQVQRGTPAWKLFTNFYSYFNVVMNLTTEQTKKRLRDKEYAALAGDYLLIMVVPAVLSGILRQALKGQDDEEEYIEEILGELIGYPLGMFVGLRETAGVFTKMAGIDHQFSYKGPAGLRFFAEMDKLGQQIGQGELDKALFKSMNSVGGLLFHYPAGQVNRMIDGTIHLLEGKTKNPTVLLGGIPY